MKTRAEDMGSGSKERALRKAVSALAQCSNVEREARWTAAVAAVDEYVAEASAARDAALEEARDTLGGAFREVDAIRTEGSAYRSGVKDLHAMAQSRLAALQSAPARLMLDAEEVRDTILREVTRAAALRLLVHLGVDLDAASEPIARTLGVCRQCHQSTSSTDGFCSDTCERQWDIEVGGPEGSR